LHGWGYLDLVALPRLFGPSVIVPDVGVKEGAQLVATSFGLTRGSIDLIESPLPFDIRKVDVHERRPDRHRLILEVPRYYHLVELPADDLHPYLLLKLQEVQDDSEALRAENHLTQYFDLLLVADLVRLLGVVFDVFRVLDLFVFEELVLEWCVLLRAIVVMKHIERVRVLQLFLLADYLALLVLFL
jgi:hypothetical protein